MNEQREVLLVQERNGPLKGKVRCGHNQISACMIIPKYKYHIYGQMILMNDVRR